MDENSGQEKANDLDCSDQRFQELSEEKKGLVLRLKEAVAAEYKGDTQTVDIAICRRYLTGYHWSLESARTRLLKTLHWRDKERPDTWECTWCQDHPGRHSMRQIGFDRHGRTVLYTSFIQCADNVFSAEESVQHMVFLMENGINAMQHRHQQKRKQREQTQPNGSASSEVPEQNSYEPEKWVVIIDCTGMTLSACNPRIASAVTSIIGDHYPERLGVVITLNAGYLMRYAWSAIKVFLPATMAQKLHFVSSEADYKNEVISDVFDDELKQWVQAEEHYNRSSPFPEQQQHFWKRPPVEVMTEDAIAAHDPRGTYSYVRNYLDTFGNDKVNETHSHRPHPNIVRELQQQACRASPAQPATA